MTLPSSGPLSLADIQTEFGGSNPISLSEYYAGGAYVPAGTSGTNGPVPTSGAISISNFYGTSNVPPLSVTADSVSGLDSGPNFIGSVTSTDSPNTTPSGGVGPYTYLWEELGVSSGNSPSVSLSTAQNPSWTAFVESGVDSISTWRVTVTDSGARTASTEITVTLTWIDNR